MPTFQKLNYLIREELKKIAIDMKKIIALFTLVVISGVLRGQQDIITLNADQHMQTTTTCNALFFDNKRNGNYAANIDYWTTLCPAQSNSRTRLDFEQFDIHPSDTVWIYYGQTINDIPATSQVTGKSYFQNDELVGKQVAPPITDVSGCLTIRLKSDSKYVASGWEARVSCEATCQDVVVALASTFTKIDSLGNQITRPVRDQYELDTVEVEDPTRGYDFTEVNGLGQIVYYRCDTVRFKAIDICTGDSVILKAEPQFPYNDASYHQTEQNCIYIWGFGDDDAGYDTVHYDPYISHKWNKISGYDLNLYIVDTSTGGCTAKNTLTARVRISQNPIKTVNQIPDMCSGDRQPVSVDYSGTSTIVIDSMHINQSEREIFETKTFLPDGGGTQGGSGCYTSTITFASFPAGLTLSDGNEILDVCMNIEHSSVGDLGIALSCPDGKTATLKYNTKSKEGLKTVFLGMPAGNILNGYLYPGTGDGNPLDDSSANPIGECWQYCWSNQYLTNAQGVMTGLTPNIVRNYSSSETGKVFVNDVIDSTHFWSSSTVLHLSDVIPADTLQILDGVTFEAKGNDTIFRYSGNDQTPVVGEMVTFETGDSYAAVSTGREYVFTLSQENLTYNVGDSFQQGIAIIENGVANPPDYGDTVILHLDNVTLYSGGTPSIPGLGSTISVLSADSVSIDDGTTTTNIAFDSLQIVRMHKTEFHPYNGDSYRAQYGEYIRTISYTYDRDSTVYTGDTSQFLQTPKQGITGNTAQTIPPTTAYTNAITTDLNGFDALIGCPLNGTWSMRICDDMEGDNGWICSWWMDVELASATDWTYSVPIDTVIWGGPYITNAAPTTAVIAPPVSACDDYTYNVKVIDDFGCEWPATTNISIVCTPIVNLGKDREICEGQTINLNAGNTGATRYDWEPTGDTTQSITITPGENDYGVHTYAAMVTNYNGSLYCYGNDTIVVNIHPAAAASFTTSKYPLEGCEPFDFQLISTSSEVERYSWTITDGETVYTSDEPSPSFVFPYGQYTVGLKVYSPYGCIDTISYQNMINVYRSPVADFGWDPSTPYASNPVVTMVNMTTPEDPDYRYRWEVQTNKNNPNDITNIFDFEPQVEWQTQPNQSVAGEYTVSLDAYSYNVGQSGQITECHDTVTKVITIVNDNLLFPTVLTPNGDGINDVFEIHNLIVGQAYPDNELAIYNRYGKRIFFAQDIRNADQFWDPDKTNSPTGTYFYRFIGRGPIRNVEFKGSVEVLRD